MVCVGDDSTLFQNEAEKTDFMSRCEPRIRQADARCRCQRRRYWLVVLEGDRRGASGRSSRFR